MADPAYTAQRFVEYYNQTFDNQRKQLSSLYREQSILTFESAVVQGERNIMDKLTLLVGKVQHEVTNIDAQPSKDGAILVVVSGTIHSDDQTSTAYSQTFFLQPEGEGGYFILNEVFRFISPRN